MPKQSGLVHKLNSTSIGFSASEWNGAEALDTGCGGLIGTSWLAVALTGADTAAIFVGVGVDALLSIVLSFVATTEIKKRPKARH